MESLFHYTTIDTLALILKNKTMRFNSLKNVDDAQEQLYDDVGNMGDSVLVSCWTIDNSENIPLWKMYSNDFKGCRIELPRIMFEVQEYFEKNRKPKEDTIFYQVSDDDLGNIGCVFAIEDIFEKIIKYVEKLNRRNYISEEQVILIGSLGIEKLDVWEFQKEFRFLLHQFMSKNSLEQLHVGKIDNFDEIFKYSYFDLKILADKIDNIKVVLGPKCGEGHKIIVEQLLEKYTKNGTVEWSNLKEKLK